MLSLIISYRYLPRLRIIHGVRGGIDTSEMASYQIPALERFDFSKPAEWPRWIRHFERFRQASDLASKSEESQVNTLIFTMGDKVDNILQSFRLSADNAKKYATVKGKFEGHFVHVKRRNTIFERAKFISGNKQKANPLTT